MKKILLIGSLTNKMNPSKTGGITVLFELLLEELKKQNIKFDVIDTLKENYANSVSAFFSVIYQLIKNINKYEHISLQATENSFIAVGPIMIVLAKIFKKQTSVRKFAGSFDEIYRNSNGLKKYLIRYVLKNSNVVFFETKYLVDYFKQYNSNTYWFPNVRRQEIIPKLPREYKRRFVFIGIICEEKGIDELCKAFLKLSDTIILDIYGPIYEKKYSNDFFNAVNINYKGALKSKDVLKNLNNYDTLVLPSHREGYPGVIIEAFSLGMPVIATKLKGIQEMVKNKENGILIDVGNVNQLVEALQSITSENYEKYSSNALKSFKNFESKEQTLKFIEKLNLKD